jgi:hypothetical protein
VIYNSEESLPLFVATPELLAYYGIDASAVHADTDLLTPRADVNGYDLIPGDFAGWHPKLQQVTLPSYTSLPNVLITPHVSGTTPRYHERITDLFCANLARYLRGEPLVNLVSAERGY